MTWLSIDWQGFGRTSGVTVKDWIKDRLREAFMQRLAELPWWCGMCGQGGNGYTPGMDMSEVMLPPSDHYQNCRPNFTKLRGIQSILDDPRFTVTEESRSPRHRRAKFTAKPPEAK